MPGMVLQGAIPIREAHAKSPILGGHFERRLQILKDTCADHDVDSDVVDAWVRAAHPRIPAREKQALEEGAIHGGGRRAVAFSGEDMEATGASCGRQFRRLGRVFALHHICRAAGCRRPGP